MALLANPKNTLPKPMAMDENASIASYVLILRLTVTYNSRNMARIKNGMAYRIIFGKSGILNCDFAPKIRK